MGGVEADDSLVNPLTRGRSIVHVLQLGNMMSQGVGMLEHNAGSLARPYQGPHRVPYLDS